MYELKKLFKSPEYFTWEEIKKVVECNLESWFISRCDYGQWDDVEYDFDGTPEGSDFDGEAFEKDLCEEYKRVADFFSVLASKVDPERLIATTQILAIKNPWCPDGEYWSARHGANYYFDMRERKMCELLDIEIDNSHMLTYVLLALEACKYVYPFDGYSGSEWTEDDPWPVKVFKRCFMSEDDAYRKYASAIFPTRKRVKDDLPIYDTPAELEKDLRTRIAENVSRFQAETFFFAIDHPNAPLTSVETEAIGIVVAEIKKSRLIELF